MRHPLRRPSYSEPAPGGLVCVRAVLDARAAPYLDRHLPELLTLPPGSAKVREAAALLRQMRGAWLALGARSYDQVSEHRAREILDDWHAPIIGDARGDAMLATLIVRSRTALLLEGSAQDADQARAELEALSTVYVDNIDDVELHASANRVVSRDAIMQLLDPPLHDASVYPRTFCMACGLWLGPIADDIDRCVDCAALLAA